MNKGELIDAVAAAADLSKADAAAALDAVVATITEALQKGEQVSVVGFGTFSVKERAARAGRNPRRAKPFKSKPAKRRVSRLAKP